MLIGTSVCLGPLLKDDAALIFNWRNTLSIAHADGVYRPMDQLKFDAWFDAGSDPTRTVFAVREVPGLRLLGFVQLGNILPHVRSAELGVMIGAEADRGKGHGQAAVRLAVDYAWRELNLQRIVLHVVGDNPRAVRAYAKAGFEVEGRLRRGAYADGGYRDVIVMSCLRAL